jgi:hypothetical protein
MHRFVQPEIVIEIRVNDIQSENASSDAILRMCLELGDAWKAVGNLPSVGLIHPVLERSRDDKGVNPTEIRIAQILERCHVRRLAEKAEARSLPQSEVLKKAGLHQGEHRIHHGENIGVVENQQRSGDPF